MRRAARRRVERRFACKGTIESSSGDVRHESFEWRWTPQFPASRARPGGTFGGSNQRAGAQSAQRPRIPRLCCPDYARAMNHRSLKQSSYDRTGGNADRWDAEPGATQEVFNSEGPGVISHIWFTIAAPTAYHLKEIVLRAYWDGNSKPSIETPVGDFFGLNLGQYVHYESAYLACSPGKSLNCYFAMPFRKSARLTVTNEGAQRCRRILFEYRLHAGICRCRTTRCTSTRSTGRQAPNVASTGEASKLNPTGKENYVYGETRGRGHLMGVTIGVQINADGWMGEGDEMIFIDDESSRRSSAPAWRITSSARGISAGGTALFRSAHHIYGAPLIVMPERTGGTLLLLSLAWR